VHPIENICCIFGEKIIIKWYIYCELAPTSES
jgi:hypothetical protein